jgi:uncharacterized membrane protein YcgQ (UPF0703/DUF1980 family)
MKLFTLVALFSAALVVAMPITSRNEGSRISSDNWIRINGKMH